MDRSSGILMHITSLPSRYGIGTMGEAAYNFIDFLVSAGQKNWQVLPINPTGFGDSPYQSFSTYAGNPFLIDFEQLCAQGLLSEDECNSLDWGSDPGLVDYGPIYQNKYTILRKAFERNFDEINQAYVSFCDENIRWLSDYAIFMAAKQAYGMVAWKDWEDEKLRYHDESALLRFSSENKKDINFYKYIQFLFYTQWDSLKKHANSRGISIIGDIPIYVAADSADAWGNRAMFHFDKNNDSVCVAGCPPDFYAHEGQSWGNPLYNWEYLKETHYDWWINRLASVQKLYDVIRIDHFRGFESYFSIDFGTDARQGRWEKGPGMDFFSEVNSRLPGLPIIAEDLGFVTDEVKLLLKLTGYPGMKVLQFAFDTGSANEYLPHHYNKHCVAYTGTHDNNTIAGWMQEAPERDTALAKKYAALTQEEGYNWGMIRLTLASVAGCAIIPLQDYLNLPSSSRMNTPATVGNNWRWRVSADYASPELAAKIRDLTDLYGRL